MARPKKRKPRAGSPRRQPPAGIHRAKPPKTRLKPLFELLGELSRTAEERMWTIEVPQREPDKHLIMFDAAVLLRASNALKAIRLLCEQAHWELAAPILRQLFELVLNMEHVARQPDRGAAIFQYSKFGLLQTVRSQHMTLLYDQKTGRPIDRSRLAVLERMLEESFPEFRSADGKRWRASWSGNTARSLAKLSEHRLRMDQYELMFTAWSEQAHAAPAALMDTIVPSAPAAQLVAADNVQIVQSVMMASTFFLELWSLLPNVPQADATERLGWTSRIAAEAGKHGAPL